MRLSNMNRKSSKSVKYELSGNHSSATFDAEWNMQGWREGSFPLPKKLPAKLICFNELASLVMALAEDTGHVCVGFYVINNRPLFGEMTFLGGLGFERIEPDEWDSRLGDMWNLALEPKKELPYGVGIRLWRQS